MQEVFVRSFCDYPECAEAHRETAGPAGQEDTSTAEFFFYTRGQKIPVIKVLLCAEHRTFLKDLYKAMLPYNMKGEE